MPAAPQVSVIVANYNYGQFVAQAIESVLAQTLPGFELIVVDDGSTDDSPAVIGRYSDPRIRLLRHEQNRGQAAAFNSGFREAGGEIVCFLDSDDWWRPEKLETVVRWHEFLRGEYGLLQHCLDVCGGGETMPYRNVLPSGDCLREMQETGNISFFVPTSGLCFTAAALREIFPLPAEIRICADAYLMRTACALGPVYSIPKTLGFYRRHKSAVFGNPEFDHYAFLRGILFPHLNAFYAARGIDLHLPLPNAPAEEASRLKAELQEARERMAYMSGSWSWRLTAPLRRVLGASRSLKSRTQGAEGERLPNTRDGEEPLRKRG